MRREGYHNDRDMPEAAYWLGPGVRYAAEVGGALGAVQLFLERPVQSLLREDVEAIAVDPRGRPYSRKPERTEEHGILDGRENSSARSCEVAS